MKPLILALLFTLLAGTRARASEFHFQAPELREPLLMAQAEGDEAYDPFSDYSEFDEASDEEADINFFRNGRFFVLSFSGGLRSFTGNMQKLYGSAPSYGLFMTFFFDLRFALQAGFLTGDHGYDLTTANGKNVGNVSVTFLDISLKYFLNTQNVTRGLADLNPYFIGGLSQVYRTQTFTGVSGSARDATMGLHFGAGLEIPLMRKKAFFGVQAMYRYFNFKDENEFIMDQSVTPAVPTSSKANGDSYDMLGIIGLNF